MMPQLAVQILELLGIAVIFAAAFACAAEATIGARSGVVARGWIALFSVLMFGAGFVGALLW